MAASKRTFDDYVTSQVDTVDSSPQHPTILAPSPSPDPPKDVTPQDQPADKKSTSDRPSGRPNDERAPGTTLLPLSRVQKIMKADKELGAAGKEAVFLIAVATEEFIKRLAVAGQAATKREGRSIILLRDLAVAVKRADELTFLEEMIPQSMPAATALGKRQVTLKEREKEKDALEASGNATGKGKGKGKAEGKKKGKASTVPTPTDTPQNGLSQHLTVDSVGPHVASREGTETTMEDVEMALNGTSAIERPRSPSSS